MQPDAARERTRQEYEQRILRVLLYLQGHLDEPLHLEALAELARYSPCHFHRIFTGMVGETVADHVRRVRQAYTEILGRWLPAQGRALGRGSPYEIYHNSPQITAPADLLTEIRVPLA